MENVEAIMEKPAYGMNNPFHYRNKAQFPVGRDKNGNVVIGFYAGRSHDIIDTESCAIGAPVNDKIVAITASMKDGTGLTKFAKEFPDRFFDIGIAEQHALGLAAGMAKEGVIPVVPIYSSFYQRAYDQVIHDIAIQNLPVIMCVDRAGVVGADRRNTSRASGYGIF